MKSINTRLQEMTNKLSSKELFESNGLGNEINFHVFDYDPEDEYIVRDSKGYIICCSKEEYLQELHSHTLTITNNITGETMTFDIEEYAIDFIYEQFNCKQIGCKITCKY